jgi:hypothetical protein
VSFVNHVHPGDTVGALTFVQSLEENIAGDLEAVRARWRRFVRVFVSGCGLWLHAINGSL